MNVLLNLKNKQLDARACGACRGSSSDAKVRLEKKK